LYVGMTMLTMVSGQILSFSVDSRQIYQGAVPKG
jgi:hypothetical protein